MKVSTKKTSATRRSTADTISLSGHELTSKLNSPRKVYTLPLEKLHPSIRIAHRLAGTLSIPKRIILDHELVLILSGKGTLDIKVEAVPFSAGDLLFIPPFTPHSFTSREKIEHVAVHFDLAAQFPPFAANLSRRPPYKVRLAQGLALPQLFKTQPSDSIRSWLLGLVTLFAQGDPLGRLRAEVLLLNVLTALLQTASRKTGKSKEDSSINHTLYARVERAVDYIESHFAEPITPTDLAHAAGMSVSHFNRLFHRWAAQSPGQFVLNRRVQEARRLLGDVNLSVKEVAARCGFEDPYYFSKVFRRIDGLPPSHFREAQLAGRSRT
jgi:AraC-like DNA-binding protein